jgi:hypothetical protein
MSAAETSTSRQMSSTKCGGDIAGGSASSAVHSASCRLRFVVSQTGSSHRSVDWSHSGFGGKCRRPE